MTSSNEPKEPTEATTTIPSGTVVPAADAVPTDGDGPVSAADGAISGTVVRALLTAVGKEAGEVGINQVLVLVGEHRPFSEIDDDDLWIPMEELAALAEGARATTGNRAIMEQTGRLLVAGDEDGFLAKIHRHLGIEDLWKHIDTIGAHWDRSATTTTLRAVPGQAIVDVEPPTPAGRPRAACQLTAGIFAALAEGTGASDVTITETRCVNRSDGTCRYEVTWRGADQPREHPWSDQTRPKVFDRSNLARAGESVDHPDTRERVAPLPGPDEGAPGMCEGREFPMAPESLATMAELVGSADGNLLERLARHADEVLADEAFVLVLQPDPEAPALAHRHRLSPDEARALLPEVGAPGDQEASGRPVGLSFPEGAAGTPVTGARPYGYLVRKKPGNKSRRKVLAATSVELAHLLATTLDLQQVVRDGKRAELATRALATFSRSNRSTREPGELLEQLVRLAGDPGWTGASSTSDSLDDDPGRDRSPRILAYLWDPGDERSDVTAASSAGRPAPSVALDLLRPELETMLSAGATIEGESLSINAGDGLLAFGTWLELADGARAEVFPFVADGELLGFLAAVFPRAEVSLALITRQSLVALAAMTATVIQRDALLRRLRFAETHDALTGLVARHLLEDRLDQALTRARISGGSVALFILGLESFTAINDAFGHRAGDDLLRWTAERLDGLAVEGETIARWTGDQFILLSTGLPDRPAIERRAVELLEVVSTPLEIMGTQVTLTASLGVAVAPFHGVNSGDLMTAATLARSEARHLGRHGYIVYAPELAAVDEPDAGDPIGFTPEADMVLDATTFADEFRRGLDADEFFVEFQPQVDLATLGVIGVEALVRWHHPRWGTLAPEQFIAQAEQSELVVAMDAWVIDETCRQARLWQDAGVAPVRLSVNISSLDLDDSDFFDNVAATLRRHGIDPGLLVLEVTERVASHQDDVARSNITQLHRLGVRFSLDHFGTGNSNLNRIGSFPVTAIKIDSEPWPAPDGNNEPWEHSLRSAISLANQLGLDHVIEGMETDRHLALATTHGASVGQGNYFGAPARGDVIKHRLVANRASPGKNPPTGHRSD